MGGHSLGSYDLLSTIAAGDSTFLARKRPFVGEGDRLYAIRLVDAETASWATTQVGRGWFPNLGPVVEVGRDSDIHFVVADVSDQQLETGARAALPPRRQAMIAAVSALVILMIGGAAWAVVKGPLADDESATAPEPAPATATAPAITPATEPAPAPAITPEPETAPEPERRVSRRILRARERQAAARQARARRVAAVKTAEPVEAAAEPEPEIARAASAAVAEPKPAAETKPALKKKRAKKKGERYCPRTGRRLPN